MSVGPIVPLETERLVLEPLHEGHAVEMVGVLADLDLYEFTGGSPPDLATLTARYRAQCEGSSKVGEDWFNWIVRTTDGGDAVGFVQATVTGSNAEVAWVVGVDHQGRGFATEAATAMVEWLVSRGVDRLEAHIHPDHRASQRVAEAIGLTRTGEVDVDGEEIWSSDPRQPT